MCLRAGGPLHPRWMSGFGNGFELEAPPGALPCGRNSPQPGQQRVPDAVNAVLKQRQRVPAAGRRPIIPRFRPVPEPLVVLSSPAAPTLVPQHRCISCCGTGELSHGFDGPSGQSEMNPNPQSELCAHRYTQVPLHDHPDHTPHNPYLAGHARPSLARATNQGGIDSMNDIQLARFLGTTAVVLG